MARILQVVAPLLLLLLPTGLRKLLSPTTTIDHQPSEGAANGGGTTTGGGEVLLHPLVLVPGLTCSELEARLTDAYRPSVPRCGAMKGKGWFGLWANCSDLPAHHYVQCFIEQMTLVYDPAANDYRNLPGVETRVRGFGSSRGFQRNPEHTTWCFEVLRHELEKAGYRDGDTLFAAQYDLRYAPPVPGQSSEVFSRYFRRLTRLIEDASEKNENKKVILFGHSFGGMVALEFVRSTPMSWRDRYIKHLILVAPVLAEGLVVNAADVRLRVRPDVHPHGHPARADSEAHVEELRVLHRQLPVPGGVRGQAARGHRAEELLRLRRGGPPGRHRLRRRRGAFHETSGPEDELLPGPHGADDVHQRSGQ